MKPHARDEGLLVEKLAEETLVYDLDRHKAHCLNRTAALVWGYCDGRTSVLEMARRLRRDLDASADEGMVWLALERLDKARLLRARLDRPAPGRAYTRREVTRRLGLAGGLAALAPAVLSIVAPTAASAATPPQCQYADCISGNAPLGCCCVNGPPGQDKACQQTGQTFNCNAPGCP